MIRLIALKGKNGNGKFAIVDDCDYDDMSRHNWYVNADGYAVCDARKTGYRSALMHRAIMDAIGRVQVDHINGERLDNRRSNLRLCNTSQNNMNMKPGARKGSSIYKGVYFNKERMKWTAMVKGASKRYNLGHFSSEVDAALAYNKKAKELFGEFFRPNIVD